MAKCGLFILSMSIIFALICLSLAAGVLYGIVIFIANPENKTVSYITRITTVSFFVTTLFLILLYAPFIFILEDCLKVSQSLYSTIYTMYFMLFIIHSLLLLYIFYCKLQSVFMRSRWALSNCTILVYKTLFVISPIICISSTLLWISNLISDIIFQILISLFLLIYVVSTMSVIAIFIRKLIQVYNTDKLNNESLINAITKSTILTTISLIVTILHLITGISLNFDTVLAHWINHYASLGDIFTNFICVILCFKLFQNLYDKLCVSLDSKCHYCWRSMLNQDAKMMEQVIEKSNTEI